MKIPLSWLETYIDISLTPHQISDALTKAGLEVDGIETIDSSYHDTVFEISLTPNLGHCASVLGVARELMASTGKSIKLPQIHLKEDSALPIEKSVKVTVEDIKETSRYSCRLIKNVKIGPSPDWMQRRLIDAGLRPINNIVDITNYVVLEMGQPLHAFDYNTLVGHEIIVRKARKDEKFVTLDGKERCLGEGDLLICDQTKPIALAGIMGGANSEVSETTTHVLLEAASFKSSTIRKTSKRLGLSTDASKRFERGNDPNQIIEALNYAAMLIQNIAGGQVAPGMIDKKSHDFPPLQVICRLDRINQVLGTQLSISEVENVFQRLSMPYHWDGQNQFTVSVPTYRVDLKEEIDLIEEVARIYGYDNITKAVPFYQASSLMHAPMFLFEREARTRLMGEGLQELLTCDLIGPSLLDIVKGSPMPEESVVKVLNPTSIEQSILRTTLLPGLLQLVKYNVDHQNHDVSGFEIGRIHFKDGPDYKEQTVAALVLTGKHHPHRWDRKNETVDFFDVKGIVENLLTELNIKEISFKPSAYTTLHSGRQASIFVGNLEIGSMGEVHPAIQRRLDVPQKIYFAELSLHDLMQVRQKEQLMEELPIYPSSERDWTVTLAEDFTLDKLLTAIHAVASPLLEEVTLVDIYRSEKLGENLKNVTLHFIYRDSTKTVEQTVVDAEHGRVISHVMKNLKLT